MNLHSYLKDRNMQNIQDTQSNISLTGITEADNGDKGIVCEYIDDLGIKRTVVVRCSSLHWLAAKALMEYIDASTKSNQIYFH